MLKFKGESVGVCVTGDIVFDIIRKDQTVEQGFCYQVYIINDDDQIDLKSTKNSLLIQKQNWDPIMVKSFL